MDAKSIGQSAAMVLVFGVVFWITGAIVILAGRLFLFPTRIKLMHCFWVGLAIWYPIFAALICSGSLETEESAKFDYEIKGNQLLMAEAPEEKVVPYWGCYDDQGRHVDDPLFVLGKVDGSNKVFTLSSRPDRAAPCDVSGHRVDIYLGSVEYNAPLTRKKVLTKQGKSFWGVSVMLVLFMGGVCFLDSYRVVLTSFVGRK